MKKAFLQIHAAVFLAGFTAILGKLIALNEGVLVWYRMLITAATMAAILYIKKGLEKMSFTACIKMSGVGAIIALHWVCFYGSIKYSNISVSLTCFSAIGFFTAVLEPLIKKRKTDFLEIFLGLLAIAGIYLVFDFYPEYETGIVFGLLAALLASLFPIFNKDLLKSYSPQTVTLYEMAGGFLALTIVIPFYLKVFPAAHYFPSARDLIWLLILAWICTILSFILQLQALKKISPFTSNLTYNLEPLYGIIFAFVIFHENRFLGPRFYYGLSLILLAVILQMIHVAFVAKSRKLTRGLYPE